MNMRVNVFHAEADRGFAKLLRRRLVEAGFQVRVLETLDAASAPEADKWVVVWSSDAVSSSAVRGALMPAQGVPLVLAVRDAQPRPAVGWIAAYDLGTWKGDPDATAFQRLMAALRGKAFGDESNANYVLPPERHEVDDFDGLFGMPKRRPGPVPAGAEPPPAARPTLAEPAGAAPPDLPLAAAPLDPMQPPEPAATPVLIAAGAPRRCVAGSPFVAALAAYTEAARDVALKHLAELGENDDRRVSDIDASHWRVGAPVVVRLAATGARVEPAEQRFEWNGREKVAAFTVTVDGGHAVVLQFAVFVADVPVASLPLRVAVGGAGAMSADKQADKQTDKQTDQQQVQGRVARSAFASYSSKDAALVTQRLSTLVRWSPGLDIFQDCLDLTPGEDFKPQLAAQIAARDVFLLFWSRQAAASPWVRWEYGTALEHKGLDAILPMPLEDPAIAPPPPELAEQHLRDRFLLAGYALAKVQEERAR
jgi:hypothetical protein